MNTAQNQTPLRRFLYVTILSLLLVVFPAMSWFYLKSGLDWRRSVQAELRNYGKIEKAFMILPGAVKINLLQGKVCVTHLFGENPALSADNKQVIEIGEKLKNQFGQNGNFRLAMVSEERSPEFLAYIKQMPDADNPVWVWTGGLGGWRTVIENAYESFCLAEKTTPAKSYLALSDTTGMIRCFYDANKKDEIDRMVTHISLLLPAE